MINGFDDVQKAGRESMERTFASFGALTKGLQTLASETADYTKRSFEDGAAHAERLFGSRSVETAISAQADYLKSSYEKAVGQATRFGELYMDITKDVTKPFGGFGVPNAGK